MQSRPSDQPYKPGDAPSAKVCGGFSEEAANLARRQQNQATGQTEGGHFHGNHAPRGGKIDRQRGIGIHQHGRAVVQLDFGSRRLPAPDRRLPSKATCSSLNIFRLSLRDGQPSFERFGKCANCVIWRSADTLYDIVMIFLGFSRPALDAGRKSQSV